MTLAASGNLSLGTNLHGSTRCIRYEITSAYGSYGLLQANTASGHSGWSMTDYYGYSFLTAPNPPTKCQTGENGTGVYCSWFDNSNNEDGFRVEYQVNGGGWNYDGQVGAGVTIKYLQSYNCNFDDDVRARVWSYNGAGNSNDCTGGTVTVECI